MYTQSMMKNQPDAFVVEKVRENFEFLTGMRLPRSKGKSKNSDGITPEQWFHQLSFVHAMLFMQSFREAEARGLLNVAELAAGREVMAVLSEG